LPDRERSRAAGTPFSRQVATNASASRCQEPASLVRHERIDACYEWLCPFRGGVVPSLEMAYHDFVTNRHECLVRAVAALDPRLLADAANPFVAARRRVADLTGV